MDHRSQCPIASALDILGDRWTLVIVRSMFVGATRFSDFLSGPERISTNVLTDRLALLEAEGIVARTAYQDHPPRHDYRLTRKGADLLPVVQALAVWGGTHLADRWAVPDGFATAVPADFYPDAGG